MIGLNQMRLMEAHRLLAIDCKRECGNEGFCDDAKDLAERMRKREEEGAKNPYVPWASRIRAAEVQRYVDAWHRSGMAVAMKSFDGDIGKANRWASNIRRYNILRPGEVCASAQECLFLLDLEIMERAPGYSQTLANKGIEMSKSGGASVRGWRMPSREEAKRTANLFRKKVWNGKFGGLKVALVQDAVLLWKEA